MEDPNFLSNIRSVTYFGFMLIAPKTSNNLPVEGFSHYTQQYGKHDKVLAHTVRNFHQKTVHHKYMQFLKVIYQILRGSTSYSP